MKNTILANIGVENFRDVGGYKTNSGKIVKQNMLYRSAKLDSITEEGRALLDELGIKTIVDFRDDEEVEDSPTIYERKGLAKYRIPIFSGDIKSFAPYLMSGKFEESGARALMCSAYRSFVTGYGKQYSEFLKLLVDESNYPVLFHCTAGKDRTGYAAALLLSLLGVQWDNVLNSYLLTNDYLKDFISKIEVNTIPEAARKAFNVLMLADEQYLSAAFTVIGKDYEAVCGYANTVLDFSIEKQAKLRSILLE
ncbi:MAG: tyrosine-protein phosphatase [Prevotellaceae bacterium]|jgi:protein-tyrosine phosphatase|nr:tyrosine-protein phosphatase [Prevotellaceae bacterium]